MTEVDYVNSTVTAIATIALVVVTFEYVKLTNSILDEQRKTRKIKELHKKLERFYIPLRQHILLHQYPEGDTQEYYKKFNNDTVSKEFMKYMYLCKNEELRSYLEELLDERKRLELQDTLISHSRLVEADIKELVQELEKLQSFKSQR